MQSDCASLLIKTLQIDVSNYTGATSSVIVNETNDNVITIEDVTIVGNNVGIGIELISNNCLIEHCNISQLQDGIYLNNSNRHIISQNILSTNARYGIYLDTVLYSNIGNNTCNLNLMGIYINNSTNNSISNNICNQNSENGIYITGSSYNTISGNTCENNDSNTANDQAGMFITNNSDFNTISGNSLNNNNNIGAGDGYGLVIATATCEENVVASNNANGNDIDWKDVGARTIIKYYVQSGDELQDAIDSIGTGAGTVIITTGTLTLTATINILGGGDYIIEGEGVGTVIDANGDRIVFNVTSAKSCVIKNLKIDASDITTVGTNLIRVDEVADNKIIIERITIIGDIDKKGYGIVVNSDNCIVSSCTISYLEYGIYTWNCDNCIVDGNIVHHCNNIGIIAFGGSQNSFINNTSHDNAYGMRMTSFTYGYMAGNYCYNNTQYGIYIWNIFYMNVSDNLTHSNGTGIYVRGSSNNNINDNNVHGNDYGIYLYSVCSFNSITGNTCNNNLITDVGNNAGIQLNTNCNDNNITGNTCCNNNNAGAGTGYGISIDTADCDNNLISSNKLTGNDTPYNDVGTGTILFGDNTVYGAAWNGDLGTPTKNAVYDVINALFPIGAKIDYFGTGIRGDMVNRDYEISVVNGDDFNMLGWFVANGEVGTPDCIDKFIRNEATSGVGGGSDDAVVVQHNHTASQPAHSHTINCYVFGTAGLNLISDDYTGINQNKSTNTAQPAITVNNAGVSGVGKNIPAKISAIPIIRMS